MNIDVFVSYHASNLHVVEKIVSKLENNGLNCWYASRDISGDYAGSIATAIKSCRVFVLVLDKATSESPHVLYELDAITNRLSKHEKVYIIPFWVADTEISKEARYYINRLHWIDATTPPFEDRFDELNKRIVLCITGETETGGVEKKEKPSTPYEGTEKYVFISYAHKDNEIVFPIITHLQNKGFRIWYDDGIEPGNEWDESIAEHIQNATIMLALISNNYIESDNCKDELKFARDENIDRILIYLEDTELPAGIKMRLGRQQAIHYFRYTKKEDFYDKITNISELKNLKQQNNINESSKLSKEYITNDFRLKIKNIVGEGRKGCVFSCLVENGRITIGDNILVNGIKDIVVGIRHSDELVETAQAGMDIYIVVKNLTKTDVNIGDIGYSINLN